MLTAPEPGTLGDLLDSSPDPSPPPTKPTRHRLRTRSLTRLLLVMLGVALLLSGAVLYTGYRAARHLQSGITRIPDVFSSVDPQQRPAPVPQTAKALTMLLLGSDSRDVAAVDPTGARRGDLPTGRSDTMMIAQLSAGTHSAAVVSLPRDSWVAIPGHGRMKLNAAYALGGPSLLIQTVEGLTGVRIDHFAVVDFAGFKAIVDAIGGVDVQIAAETQDLTGRHFQPGLNHLDGDDALAYVRQRYGLPGGDLDRVRRQQNLLRAVLAKAATLEPVRNPLRMYRLLDSTTRAVSVDSGLTNSRMRSLASQIVALRGETVAFLTAPVSGTGWEGDQSVVYLDRPRCLPLWTALRSGDVRGYVSAHPADLLAAVPR